MPSDADQLALHLRRLRLRHFEILLAIDRHGSLTATAEALGISQPAVSQSLAEIEDALGVQLFLRGRQIKPSPSHSVVLRHARRMVADSFQLQAELRAVTAGALGSVRIGTMLVASAGVLPRALLKIGAQPQAVQIDVVEDTAAGLWARMDRHELDLIVGRLDERAFAPQVRCEALFNDLHCVVAGREHPLSRASKIVWRKAAGYPWILPQANTALRRAIDSTFLEHGLAPPSPQLESTSNTLIQELMRHTDCLAVVSGTAARHFESLGLLAVLPLGLKYDVGPVGMVWDTPDPGPALARVMQALREAVAPDEIGPRTLA
ncbi:MAG: LysR substrate-binding domain-containing protein [Burkholderiaceae bacterium]